MPGSVRAARRRRLRAQENRRDARHRGRNIEVAGVQGADEIAGAADMTTPHPDGVTLSDYVAGDASLEPAARADLAAHVASCRDCQAMVDSLREISAAARRLPPLTPRREAWNRIERALRADGADSKSRVRRRPLWPWLAAAAAVLLTTLVGFKVVDLRRQSAQATSAAGPDIATAQSVEAELAQAEQHYQKAIAGLEQIANAEKGTLDPQ